ncbi:hypothetical protein D3C87_2019170 [compost metagenome]
MQGTIIFRIMMFRFRKVQFRNLTELHGLMWEEVQELHQVMQLSIRYLLILREQIFIIPIKEMV